MSEENSDPLPYTQLDRAVKAPAARLAERLKVTYQHALGGLAEFWELCGDPRDLEKLLDQGLRDVVLEKDDVMGRFALAMSVDTSAITVHDLCRLRLLELQADGRYRIRGMSRYFKVIEWRRIKREAGAAGGRRSAQVRAERYGSAQPRSESASESASVAASGDTPQPTLFPEAQPEAAPKHGRTQRTADSGQLQDRSDRAPAKELNANELWDEISEVFESCELPVPEIHPAERNDRIKTLKGQLPKDRREVEPKLLPQVVFAAIECFPGMKSADNPLAYLQTLLKQPESRATLLAHVEELSA